MTKIFVTLKVNTILISQPLPASIDKSPFGELIEKNKKIDVQFVPFIQVEGVSSRDFRSQRIDVLSHTAIIFTSRTTIDSFFKICDDCRIVVPEDMKYFCVTEAIALYLQKYIVYRKRKIFFGKGTFADLVDLVVKHKEEKFIIALSDPHKPEIPKTLDKAKLKYDKVILTRTVSKDVKNDIDDINKYDLLVFYSPFEIRSLLSNFGDKLDKAIPIATFGTGTAQTAYEAGLKVVVLAPTKEFPSMGMAVSNYIEQVKKGENIDTQYILDSIKEASVKSEELIAKVKTISKSKKSVVAKKKSAVSKKDNVASKKDTSKLIAVKKIVKAKQE